MGTMDFYDYSAGEESFPGSAACVNEECLYFTTYNNNLLYKLDLQTGIYQEWAMPYVAAKNWPYRKLFICKNKLIFAPMNSGVFLQFDLDTKKFLMLNEILPDEVSCSFRDGIQKEERLILLGSFQNVIVILDMETMQCIEWIKLPELEQGDCYVNMSFYYGDLLIFCKKKRAVLQVDMHKKSYIWKVLPETIYHGWLDGEKLYYISVQTDVHEICSFNLSTEKKLVIGNYEETEKEEAQVYRYWNAKKIKDFIFFLPHETSQILRVNITSGRIESINPFQDEDCCLRMERFKAVFNILLWEKVILVIPYYGNKISLLDEKNGEIIKEYRFPLSKERLMQRRRQRIKNEIIQGLILKEHEILCKLEDFLEEVSGHHIGNDCEFENIGKDIWRIVK